VPFPQDGPIKITQLSIQIALFFRFAVTIIKHGLKEIFTAVSAWLDGLRFDGFTQRFADSSPSTVEEEGVMTFFQGFTEV